MFKLRYLLYKFIFQLNPDLSQRSVGVFDILVS